jgi:hypothetical protein
LLFRIKERTEAERSKLFLHCGDIEKKFSYRFTGYHRGKLIIENNSGIIDEIVLGQKRE